MDNASIDRENLRVLQRSAVASSLLARALVALGKADRVKEIEQEAMELVPDE